MSNGKRRWLCNDCRRLGTSKSMQSRVEVVHRFAIGRPKHYGQGFCRNGKACAARKARLSAWIPSQAEAARRKALHDARVEWRAA